MCVNARASDPTPEIASASETPAKNACLAPRLGIPVLSRRALGLEQLLEQAAIDGKQVRDEREQARLKTEDHQHGRQDHRLHVPEPAPRHVKIDEAAAEDEPAQKERAPE